MYIKATTPPYGPVMMSLDAVLQNEAIRDFGEPLYIPKFFAAAPPQGDDAAVKEAARMLANAERPVIVVDRAARTQNGVRMLVELAELLQAPVVDQGGRMNFPNTHYLSRPANVIADADVVIGMELSDFWNTVNGFVDNGDDGFGKNLHKLKPGTKLISISSVDLITKSNYQDFQRFQSIDISMPGDAEATLPSLIEALKSAISNDRKDAMSKRGDAIRQAHAKGLDATKQAAAIAWDANPVSTARLVTELYAQIKDLDWSLVSTAGNTSSWANRLWPMEKHYQWLGSSGGYGVGYGAPASIGAALGNRDQGRFSVSIQSDGDLMYAPGVLWTAVRHKIPLLAVMHNNRGYHQEAMHVLRFANFRNRVVNTGNDLAPIGTSIMNPDIAYHDLAKSMGWWAKGPITDPADLGPAGMKMSFVRLSAASLLLSLAVGVAGQGAALADGDAQKGKVAFVKNGCWQCHDYNGQGSIATSGGRVIARTQLPVDAFISFVRTTNGQMPPFRAPVISDADLTDIYAYLQSLPEPKKAADIPLLNNGVRSQ
jgi:thiamine pyrophosphate-dependent acetolactate synthase large subunit-like protein/cytochrome c553